MSEPEHPRQPFLASFLLYGGAAGLAIVCALEAGLKLIGVGDLWWGLATGRYITENGEVPKTDVFSHTFAGQPWFNPEWLSHVLFYNLYHHLGEDWIVYLRIALICLIFGVCLAVSVIRSRSWLASLLSVAFGAWVCRPFLDSRPQLFTFLFSILVLLILDLLRRRGRNVLFLLPLIFLLWTQLHGGYVFGLCLLLGTLLAESGKRRLGLPADPLSWKAIRSLAVFTLLSMAAVLINPWGPEAYSHLLDLFSGPRAVFIELTAEWLPPELFSPGPFNPLQFWIYLPLLALVTVPIAWTRWRSFDLEDFALAVVVLLGFALRHQRFIPLFTILTVPLASQAVSFWAKRWLRRGRDAGPELVAARRARASAAVAAAAWLLLVVVLPFRLLHLHRSYGVYLHSSADTATLFRANIHYPYYPEAAVRLLKDIGIKGRVFNLYGWGGYLQFRLPEQRTFVDGRGSLAYGAQLFVNYLRAHEGQDDWKSILDRYDVTYALIHREDNAELLRAMDRDRHWTWIFAHDTSAVLLRRSPENRRLLARLRARELPLPDTGMTHFLYGRRAEDDGDLDQAVSDFSRAAEMEPGDELFRSHLILALAAAGRAEEAAAEAESALEDIPGSAPILAAAASLEIDGRS